MRIGRNDRDEGIATHNGLPRSQRRRESLSVRADDADYRRPRARRYAQLLTGVFSGIVKPSLSPGCHRAVAGDDPERRFFFDEAATVFDQGGLLVLLEFVRAFLKPKKPPSMLPSENL